MFTEAELNQLGWLVLVLWVILVVSLIRASQPRMSRKAQNDEPKVSRNEPRKSL